MCRAIFPYLSKPCYSHRPWPEAGCNRSRRVIESQEGDEEGGGWKKKWEVGWFSQESCAKVAGVGDRSRGGEKAWGSAVTDERSERAGKPWVEQAWGNSAIEPSSSKRDRTEEFDPGSD